MTKISHYTEMPHELGMIQRALAIGATHEQYVACVKALNQKVRFECPLGECVDALAGFAWVWKMRGLLTVQPIIDADRFNAQGLEGKVSIPCTLYDALFYAMQASSEYRSQSVRNA